MFLLQPTSRDTFVHPAGRGFILHQHCRDVDRGRMKLREGENCYFRQV